MENMYCLKKSGDSSKPPITYNTFALVHALCSKKVLMYLSALAVLAALLCSYYLYLDGLYLVDEVLEGTGPKELSLKEKLTIRLVAPRKLEDLAAFVLEYSVCQPVNEIQVIWLHEQSHPVDSHFKYPHTHSKVTFHNKYGKGAWDSLFGEQLVAETESVMFIDPDVYMSCSDIAFAQSVWRSSVSAVVGFFPRHLEWQKGGHVNIQGLGSIVHQGQYSLMAAAGVIVRKEYLQSMMHGSAEQSTTKYLDDARAHVRDFVNQHPHCADLALSLWPSGTSALHSEHAKAGGERSAQPSSPNPAAITHFPSGAASPPIWVDLSSLQIRAGVELSRYPHMAPSASAEVSSPAVPEVHVARALSAGHEHDRGHSLAAEKVALTPEMSDMCATELVRLLKITPETLPAAHFKSTRASSHIYW